MKAIQNASQELLRDTYDVLLKSRRRIESFSSFTMGYGTSNGPCCYIGTVDAICDEFEKRSLGDIPRKPEHKLALEVLDHVGITRNKVPERYHNRPGGWAEAIGFDVHDKVCHGEVPSSKEKNEALDIFKDAICQVWAGLDAPSREILVEPLETTEPAKEPVSTPEPVEVPEREPVPA